jgi:hypothetical protein
MHIFLLHAVVNHRSPMVYVIARRQTDRVRYARRLCAFLLILGWVCSSVARYHVGVRVGDTTSPSTLSTILIATTRAVTRTQTWQLTVPRPVRPVSSTLFMRLCLWLYTKRWLSVIEIKSRSLIYRQFFVRQNHSIERYFSGI